MMPVLRSPKRWRETRRASAKCSLSALARSGLKLRRLPIPPAIPIPICALPAEMAELTRHIIHTYPDFYPYFSQRDFTWNNIHQQNRNPLLGMGIGADGLKTGETQRRLQLGRLGDTGQFPTDCRRQRREIRQRARRPGQEIVRFWLPRLSSASFVCRRSNGGRRQGVWR